MKKLFAAVIVILAVIVTVQLSAMPDTLNYQGRLYSPPFSATPAPDSTGNTVIVRIYNVPSGPAVPLWQTTTYNVRTKGGLFSFDFSGFGTSLDFDEDYWMSVEFNYTGEMNPWHQLLPAPYAGRSQFVSQVDPTTKIFGPLSVTSSSITESAFSVTSTGTTSILGIHGGVTNGAGVAGYNTSTSPYSAGIYGYGSSGIAVYGEASGTAGVAVQGEHKNGGMGAYFKGLTGVAISSYSNGVGLYIDSTSGGTPLIVEGNNASRIKGGLVVDTLSSPAGMWVSFTAGAWPAMIITSPNGQGLVIKGSSGGMSKPVLDVNCNTTSGNANAIAAVSNGTAISATSTNLGAEAGVYGAGFEGVKGETTGLGIGVHGKSPGGPGTGVMGMANGGSGTGVLAQNINTIGVNTSGSALYVSGSVKTSGGILNTNTTAGNIWNVNGGANLTFGPSGSIRCSAPLGTIDTISIKSPMITANSVLVVSFVTASPPASHTVTVSTGTAIITIPSTGFGTGEGFNFLIIN